MSKSRSKSARDNRANQLNPNHPAYHRSRGAAPSKAARDARSHPPARDNRSRQLNPQDAAHTTPQGDSSESSPASSDTSSARSE